MKKSFLVGVVTGAVSLVGAKFLKLHHGCCGPQRNMLTRGDQ